MPISMRALRLMRDAAKALRDEADAIGDRALFMRASRRWQWAIERIGART